MVSALKNFAFKYSPYPVILSIENHCCFEQQGRMADIFMTILGDMILKPGEFLSPEVPGTLPSPDQLKRKIIIKGKKMLISDDEDDLDEEEEEDMEEDDMDDETSVQDDIITTNENKSRKLDQYSESPNVSLDPIYEDEDVGPSDQTTDRTGSLSSTPSKASLSSAKSRRKLGLKKIRSKSSYSFNSSNLNPSFRSKKALSSINPKLSDLTFLGTCKHRSFEDSDDISCDLMSSFGEGKTLKFIKRPEVALAWMKHNRHHLRYSECIVRL